MDKERALRVIVHSAHIYDEIFNEKNLLIIVGNNNKATSSLSNLFQIETIAHDRNFFHLTGLDEENINFSRADFFSTAFSGNLKTSDFEFKDNTTELKLNVIERVLLPSKNFRMFGKYDGNRPNLETDYLIGGETGSIGFVKTNDSDFYVPNTVLNGDMRDDVSSRVQVLAVLQKDATAPEYRKAIYVAKNVFLHELFEKIQHQNPNIHINIDYETELTKSQLAKEKEFMQKAEITELAGRLNQARNSYLNDSENMDLLEQYDTAQKNFPLKVKEYNMYDYAESLLNQQKAVSKSSEVREYIDSDIRALKKECGLTVRSTNIVQNVYAASPESNQNTSAIAHKTLFAFPLPPEHPFKALWVKTREIVRNISDSFHRTEKSSDKTGLSERNTPVDKEETSKQEETFFIELYNTSVRNQNGYIEFIYTAEAMDEIELQTELLFEQTAVQEHSRQQEQV